MWVKKSLISSTLLLGLLQIPYASATSCNALIGTWENSIKSTLNIRSIDQNGQLTGTYQSRNAADNKAAINGWVSLAKPAQYKHFVKAISFSGQWDNGAIGSWTGYCFLNSNKVPTIKMVWTLVTPNSAHSWEHINTNTAQFHPQK